MKKYLTRFIFLNIFRVLIPLLLLNTVTGYAQTQAWQSTDFITNSFFEVALGFEHRKSAQKVRKWNKPIRVFVEHQVGDSVLHDELLNAHIKDLNNITKLDIRRVNTANKANIQFYFTSQKKLPDLVRRISGKRSVKLLKTSVCMATVRAKANGEISSAVVYIAVNQARMHAKLLSCIVEEITQVLGLPRDSEQVFPSIFNDKSTNQLLTGLDIILLKLLYNDKLRAGMSKSQVRPIIKNIIGKWRSQGVLKRADQQSRTLQLCQYMDC